MKHRDWILALIIALGLLVAVSGCSSEPPDTSSAAGVYEMEGDRVEVVGTLKWVDLEGGFWAVADDSAEEGLANNTLAVLANGEEFASELQPLEGERVSIIGIPFDGMSIRMAGPEVTVESVSELE